jgi:hypothetical protein
VISSVDKCPRSLFRGEGRTMTCIPLYKVFCRKRKEEKLMTYVHLVLMHTLMLCAAMCSYTFNISRITLSTISIDAICMSDVSSIATKSEIGTCSAEPSRLQSVLRFHYQLTTQNIVHALHASLENSSAFPPCTRVTKSVAMEHYYHRRDRPQPYA